ncbi:MAG: helix-turn-helix domain-containing protein [Gloeotrichia echinulata DVL01]
MTIKKPLAINQPEVGRIIRNLRLLARLTQEQFAATLGVTYTTINRWENGRSKPRPWRWRRLRGCWKRWAVRVRIYWLSICRISCLLSFCVDDGFCPSQI